MIIRKYTRNYWDKKTSPVQEKHYTPNNERAYLFAMLDRLARYGYSAIELNQSEEDIFITYKQYGITLEKRTNYPTFNDPEFPTVRGKLTIEILPDNWRQNRSKQELRYQSHSHIKAGAQNIQEKIYARAYQKETFNLPF